MKRFLQYLRENQNAFDMAYEKINRIKDRAIKSIHDPATVEKALDALAGHHGTIMAIRTDKGKYDEQIFDLYRHASRQWRSVADAAKEHGHFDPRGALRQHAEIEGMEPHHPVNFVNPYDWKRRSEGDVTPYDVAFTRAAKPIPERDRNAKPLGESILWLMEKSEQLLFEQKKLYSVTVSEHPYSGDYIYLGDSERTTNQLRSSSLTFNSVHPPGRPGSLVSDHKFGSHHMEELRGVIK